MAGAVVPAAETLAVPAVAEVAAADEAAPSPGGFTLLSGTAAADFPPAALADDGSAGASFLPSQDEPGDDDGTDDES